MADINDLNVTDASNTARFPENMAFSAVNDSARALEGIIARWHKDTNGSLVSTGSANAYVLAANQTLSAYAQGQLFLFEANFANTGAATLNVDSIGAKAIKKHNDQALVAGDIESGQIVAVVYEAAADAFQMFSQLGNAGLQSSDIGTSVLAPDGDGSSLTGIRIQGKETIWVPAAAMRPTASNGCASLTEVETTAGRPDMQVLDFDATSDEHAQFAVRFPKSWNEGTVTFQFYWTSTATDTDGVSFGLQGVAVSDGDSIDVAYGTAVVVDDANQSTAEDLYVSAESGAVTIAGSPAAGDLCFFRVFRDVSDANDTATEDARLIGVALFFTTDAGDDT